MALDLNCTNEQKILVTAAPVTAAGFPAPLDGPLTVSVVGGDATFEMNGNLAFYAVSGAAPGDSTFLVSADADLGSGVVTIQDTVVLHVSGALAASFGLSAGAPEAK